MNHDRGERGPRGATFARRVLLVAMLVLLGVCPGVGAATNAEVVHEAAVVATVVVIVLQSLHGRRQVCTPSVASSSRPVGAAPVRVAPHGAPSWHWAPRRGPPPRALRPAPRALRRALGA